MSHIIRRTAVRSAMQPARPMFAASSRVRFSTRSNLAAVADAHGDREAGKQAVKTGAKRDPELLVLLAIMSGVFGLAGWHFSSSPTSATSEAGTAKIHGSEPWKSGSEGKYMYHPGGDKSQEPKSAPSALNTVIIPNVTLPKELHDKYNKYGKEDYP